MELLCYAKCCYVMVSAVLNLMCVSPTPQFGALTQHSGI